VSTLGRGWYFGGHLDDFTTQGWSNQVARVYLKSLLEFTFPGATNKAVDSLKEGKTAGSDGVFRNITQGGLQTSGSFPSRADGALVYIPGFGAEGILLGLTGGDNDTFVSTKVRGKTRSIELTVFADADERHRCLRYCELDLVQAEYVW